MNPNVVLKKVSAHFLKKGGSTFFKIQKNLNTMSLYVSFISLFFYRVFGPTETVSFCLKTFPKLMRDKHQNTPQKQNLNINEK